MVDQQIVDQQQFIHNFWDNNFWDNSNNNNYIKQQQYTYSYAEWWGDREGGAIRTPVYMFIY